jgi:hypothetical protein
MAGILRTDTIQNSNTSTIITQTNSTTITIGTSGQTVALASGATSSGFGATYNGAVNWDTTPKTTTVTAVSGVGYFVNTTSGAITVNLPAGSAGSIVAIADYANTAATNNITITPNGSQKIQGSANNFKITVNGGTITLVYVDSTQGWRPTDAATASSITEQDIFISATGGTITTSGDYKIHTFTGPGTFCVSAAAGPVAVADYLVVAGGGGRRATSAPAGGGGAGGYRESKATGAPWTASPLASSTSLPISVTSYPITVGAGGAGVPNPATSGGCGSSSIFSTITSAGGGYGGDAGGPGGSGGGKGNPIGPAVGSGNTPPVSPPQGNSGGTNVFGPASVTRGGGGGGAGAVGAPGTDSGNGGAGVSTSITASSVTYAGGGGGGSENYPAGTGGAGGGGNGGQWPACSAASNGTANTGGGAGSGYSAARNGGSGIVVIRYRYQ